MLVGSGCFLQGGWRSREVGLRSTAMPELGTASPSLQPQPGSQRLAAMRRPWNKVLIPEFSPSSPGEEQGADWLSRWALSLQAPSVSAAARRVSSNSRDCSPESCASDTRWITRTPLQLSNAQGPQLLTDHSANKRNPPEPCPDQS